MIDASNVGDMFDAILAHAIPAGPLAELQQHYGLQANQIPISLLETRAVTTCTRPTWGRPQQPIIVLTCSRTIGGRFPWRSICRQ